MGRFTDQTKNSTSTKKCEKKVLYVTVIYTTDDDQSDSGAEGTMAITPAADDAPPVSAAPESLTSPPGEEQTRSMEVDDGDEHQTPASPISHRKDELLTGDTAVGVEGEMANLTVSSPGDYHGSDEGASI